MIDDWNDNSDKVNRPHGISGWYHAQRRQWYRTHTCDNDIDMLTSLTGWAGRLSEWTQGVGNWGQNDLGLQLNVSWNHEPQLPTPEYKMRIKKMTMNWACPLWLNWNHTIIIECKKETGCQITWILDKGEGTNVNHEPPSFRGSDDRGSAAALMLDSQLDSYKPWEPLSQWGGCMRMNAFSTVTEPAQKSPSQCFWECASLLERENAQLNNVLLGLVLLNLW